MSYYLWDVTKNSLVLNLDLFRTSPYFVSLNVGQKNSTIFIFSGWDANLWSFCIYFHLFLTLYRSARAVPHWCGGYHLATLPGFVVDSVT